MSALARELLRPWNLMSIARIPLAVVVLLVRSHPLLVLVISALAGLSDLLDGWMARRANADHSIGAWLDPLTDKIFVLALLLAVVLEYEPPWWLIGLTATRELIMALLYAVWLLLPHRRGINFTARPSGKATTVAQFSVVTALLMDAPALAGWLAYVAGALGLFATLEYAWRARRTLPTSDESPSPVPPASDSKNPASDSKNPASDSKNPASDSKSPASDSKSPLEQQTVSRSDTPEAG